MPQVNESSWTFFMTSFTSLMFLFLVLLQFLFPLSFKHPLNNINSKFFLFSHFM